MKPVIKQFYTHYSAVVIGFIGVLGIHILWELHEAPLLMCGGLVLALVAIYLAKKTAQHFHGHHHHAADSAIDIVAPTVLFLANILHPAVDGFSFYQTLQGSGVVAASIVGVGIILHEILRQSALVSAFRPMGIRWYVVLITAVIGIASGIGLGVAESAVIEKYEYIADLATIFAYSFVIAEFYYHKHSHTMSKKSWWIVVGGLIALVIQYYMSAVH